LKSQILISNVRSGRGGVALSKAWRLLHFRGIFSAMKVAMDSAGRIVVPKALREALDLKPGQPLEILARDGRLEIEVAPTPIKLPTLTADEVRATLERLRR
jgi:AbrB family looped-hinge helix DNA binding protein